VSGFLYTYTYDISRKSRSADFQCLGKPWTL